MFIMLLLVLLVILTKPRIKYPQVSELVQDTQRRLRPNLAAKSHPAEPSLGCLNSNQPIDMKKDYWYYCMLQILSYC